ncbi:MAG: dihydrofolate reductase [Prevotellaceae bacterium]|jgi:dihydrofolate reductase|nr:dihydrofolate reductase [Prevotellaceae bacterium]
MLALIAAIDENNALGKNNALPWHIRADLKRFKSITSGHTVVMGRRTFESIGKPLPDRTNIVLSRSLPPESGIVAARSLDEALDIAAGFGREIFVVGGASVYRQALPFAEKIYLTLIGAVYDGADAFFPELQPDEWKTELRETGQDDQFPFPFTFITLNRI